MQRLVVFLKRAVKFCQYLNLYISDYEWFGSTNDTFAYLSDAHFIASWLGHYIYVGLRWTSVRLKSQKKLPSSDHLPLSVAFRHDDDDHIDTDIANRDTDGIPYSHNQTCNRHKAPPEDISRYEHTTKTFPCNARMPLEALSCVY